MGSWVLHAAGLPVEELSRNPLQVLGVGCKPSQEKVTSAANPGPPPPGTICDSQGEWWVLGDLARHSDSASRCPRNAKAQVKDIAKFHLGVVHPCPEDAGGRTLLLPDFVEARGQMGEPRAICASGSAPGLPLQARHKGAQCSVPPSPSSARMAMHKRGDVRSKIEVRVTDAHHSVVQRRMRSSGSEFFTLIVPCCRVTLGRGSYDEWPLIDASQWPAFVSAVVLGGRVDGEAAHLGKVVQTSEGKKRGVRIRGAEAGNRVKWTTSIGDNLLLDFHNGPVSRGPKGQSSKFADFLEYLDNHWVHKVQRFPSTWSVLWVETLDTQMVMSELEGLGMKDICPSCSTQLLFGAAHDKDADVESELSDEEENAQELHESTSSSSLSSESSAAPSAPDTPDILGANQKLTEEQSKTRRATKLVKKIFRDSQVASTTASFLVASQRSVHSSPPSPSKGRFISGAASKRMSIYYQGASSQVAAPQGESCRSSLTSPTIRSTVSASDSGDEASSSPRVSTRQSLRVADTQGHQGDVDAWAEGTLPCSRCQDHHMPATHALICPKYDLTHSYFKPLCIECREALEVVFEQDKAREAARKELEELEDDAEAKPTLDDAQPQKNIGARFDLPTRPGFAAEQCVISTATECCLAIEVELRLNIEKVSSERHQLLLDELRDEVRRALQLPLRQVFVLQDTASRNGIFQIGILHPWLVPTQVQRRKRRRALKTRAESPEDESEVDLESTDTAEDLGQMWDRLVFFFYGDAARHRTRISNAFPLLRCHRRDMKGLQWSSATVAPVEKCKALVENMHVTRERGGDDGLAGDDSDFENVLQTSFVLPEDEDVGTTVIASSRTHDYRRRSTPRTPRRASKYVRVDKSDSEASEGRRPGTPPLSKKASTQKFNSSAQQSQPEVENVRAAASNLRPPYLQDLLMVLPDVPSHELQPKLEHTWQKNAAKQCWKQKAQDVGLLPPMSEINEVHLPILHLLVWQDDLAGFIDTLRRSCPAVLNATDRMGRTPLHFAIACGKPEMVSLLMGLAAPRGPIKAEEYDAKGRAPLHYAAFRGEVAIVDSLIRMLKVPSLDITETNSGDTALLISARAMHIGAVRLLIQAAASVNLANRRCLTPLHAAAASGAVDCCELLISMRANFDALDALDRTPLEWAVMYGNSDTEKMLRKFQSSLAPCAVTSSHNIQSKIASPAWIMSCRPKTQPAPSVGRRPMPAAIDEAQTPARASTAPASMQQTQRLRKSLLDGCQAPPADIANLGYDGWAGNAGSLAVRWRNWAQGAFPDNAQITFSKSPCLPTRRGQLQKEKLAPKPRKLNEQVPMEPTRAQLADAADALGAVFCTVCWEYVLEGHQAH